MSRDYSKLRGAIVEHFGTQSALAKELELSENSLSRKMNGKIDWSTEEIVKLTALLNIPREKIGEYFF